MNKIYTRKIIALSSMALVLFAGAYSIIFNVELTQSANAILAPLFGFIGWYFGKSTALEQPRKDGE